MEKTKQELDTIKASLDRISMRIEYLKSNPNKAYLTDKELDIIINQLIEIKISLKIPD